MPKLPRGVSAQKLQAILAGLLEEQLLDDPEQLHMVLLGLVRRDSASRWVAVCSKPWLQQAVVSLQNAQVPLTSIVPLSMPLEASAVASPEASPSRFGALIEGVIDSVMDAGSDPVNRWHAYGDSAQEESMWLTYSDSQGVMTLPLNCAHLLGAMDEDTLITAEPAVAAAAERALKQRVAVVPTYQHALQAVQEAKLRRIDLAQGSLAFASSKLERWLRASGEGVRSLLTSANWRPARWGIAVICLANLIGLNAWSYKQSAQLADKRTQMNQLLAQSFPNVKVVVDAPLQMQRELANLRQAQGQLSGRDFESIYGRFSALARINTTPDAIEYVANEVQIRGSGLAARELDGLLPRLSYAGLVVRSDAQALIVSHKDASPARPAPSVGTAAPSVAGGKP